MNRHVVACDIGGSVTRVAVAGMDRRIRRTLRTPTPLSPGELVREISSLSALAARRAGLDPCGLTGMGVAVPAAVDRRREAIGRCENIPGLSGFPLGKAMREASGVPVVLENDANAAAMGERVHGGAVGERDFALVIVGTGVGMGAVVDGHLLRGSAGAAGELGYVPVDHGEGDEQAPLYHAICGPGIRRFADSVRDAYPGTAIGQGACPAEIFAAAEEGDPLGRAVLGNTARHLSRALCAVVALLDPSLVLLGGGVGGNPVLLASVRRRMKDLLARPPAVRAARLADHAGVAGAAVLAWAAAAGPHARNL